MIRIENVGPGLQPGERCYVIKINRAVIGTFLHIPRHGIAECLRRAVSAVEFGNRLARNVLPSGEKGDPNES